MGNIQRAVLIGGLVGGLWAGTITTTSSAQAFGPGGISDSCDTSLPGSSSCTAAVGRTAAALSESVAGNGFVSAYIQGGAVWIGSNAFASSWASVTQTYMPIGGTGVGVATIWESELRYGTGSLSSFAPEPRPVSVQISESFVYGQPFTLTLSAFASSSFIGAYGDGGSLLVEKRLESISFAGIPGLLAPQTSIGTSVGINSAPEPATWVLGLIGLGLIGFAKSKVSGESKKAK